MNCADANLLIHPYIDRELDVVRAIDFEQHVRTCANCAAQQKSLLSLRSVLGENDLAYSAPLALREKIHPNRTESSRKFRLFWPWLAFGAAAVALIVMMLRPATIPAQEAFLDQIVASHVRSLQGAHLMDVASTDQHTVKPWFDGRIDFAPEVKNFAPEGFALIGGRLDYLENHTAAALVYQHNKHIVNVFISPQTKSHPWAGEESRRGYSIVAFDANGFSYDVISDTDMPTVEHLSELLGKK